MKSRLGMVGDIALVMFLYAVMLAMICGVIYGMLVYWWMVMT